MDIIGKATFIVLILLIAPWLLIMSLPFVLFGVAEAIVNKYIKTALKLYRWFIEPWPLHIFPVLAIAHIVSLNIFAAYSEKINDVSSALFQLSGGLMILWILSLNIGIITKTSLFKSFCEYFKRFPLLKRSGIFLSANINAKCSISSPELKVTPAFKNLEDKVDFLQTEIIRLENEIKKSKYEAQEKIQKTEKKLMEEIASVKSQIEETNSKIKGIVAGGAKWEILGALNISYGLIIPLVY